MNKKDIRKSVDFANGWDWTDLTWTDESKRLQFGYFDDDTNLVGIMYWHKHDNCWIVTLCSDEEDKNERYGVYVESSDFEMYENARDYAVGLTEQYP